MAITELLDNSTELQENLSAALLAGSPVIKVNDLRSEYAKKIEAQPFNDAARAKEIANSDPDQPIFKRYELHPEDLPDRMKFIQMITDTSVDIAVIDSKIIDTANKYTLLISDVIDRMNIIKQRLQRDKQRLEDINFITNAYKGIGTIIPIVKENISGSCTYQNDVYSAAGTTETNMPIEILSVSGNGYVGNAHVLTTQNTYMNLEEDRGVITNLSDNSTVTIFEYSRICSKNPDYYTGTNAVKNETYDVNYDNKDAVCTITMQATAQNINSLRLDTTTNQLILQDILVSNDNLTYTSALKQSIDFSTDMYHAMNYIPGSDTISFVSSPYVKLVLSSDYTNEGESLGYDYVDVSGDKPETVIRPIEDAERKVIQLNGITAYAQTYKTSTFISTNLAPENGCQRVALFVNDYIPDSYSRNDNTFPILYELIVNGTTYMVIPINSSAAGTKIISCSDSQYSNANTRYIDSKIKTIQLRVTLTPSSNNISPYVGNLKLCIG